MIKIEKKKPIEASVRNRKHPAAISSLGRDGQEYPKKVTRTKKRGTIIVPSKINNKSSGKKKKNYSNFSFQRHNNGKEKCYAHPFPSHNSRRYQKN
jgi:hypothetical protein